MASRVFGRAGQRLVERDREIATLHDLADAGAEGVGALAVLVGAAGIGKTSVLAAIEEDVPVFRVLSARAGELEREFPYGVMRQLFEPLLRACGQAERGELLSGAAAPAGALLGGEAASVPADGAALDHAFYWLTANLSHGHPLLPTVDDAHWSDLASLRALVHLARRLEDLPVAMIVAARPVEQGPSRMLLERLGVEARHTVELAALSEFGVRSLIDRRLDGADEGFCHACRTATGGNPFLVSELIAAVHASGIEPVKSNTARVRSIGPRSVMRSVPRISRGHWPRPSRTSIVPDCCYSWAAPASRRWREGPSSRCPKR